MNHMVGMIALGMRWGSLLLALVLVMTACSETSPTTTTPLPTTVTTSPPTTTSTTTTSTTTTTVAVTTTTVDPLARPDVLISNVNRDSINDFDTSKDNIYEAVIELLDLFNYLEAHPTDDANEMVSMMFERDYPYWSQILISFLELEEHPGWHYSDAGIQILAIEILSFDSETAVVQIADYRETQLIIDDAGVAVATYDGWDRRLGEFRFRRGADDLWRFNDAGPSTDLSDETLSSMVPVQRAEDNP